MSDYYWPDEARTRHLYVPGMSGYGKTTLMANLALDDLEFQSGPLVLIDPKGSSQGLVEIVLRHIPKGLADKTSYISLDHPTCIDLLGYRNPREKNFVRNDIITILKRFSYGSWGPTMQATLNNLIPTLLEAKDATFLDIGRFLESKKRQEQILAQVSPERKAYWKENPPSKSDVGPIASRMSNFYEPPLSTIVGGRRGEGLNIADIIERNQILLVDTSPLSEDGLILGALVMSRIQQAIFRRSPNHEYSRCHVYADEFHNFVTSAFNVMLSQARSFNLSLCMANQHPKQISDIWDDVVGNVSSYMIFRMDGSHAALLKSKIAEPQYDAPGESFAERERRRHIQEARSTISAIERSIERTWNEGGDLDLGYKKIERQKQLIEQLEESSLTAARSRPVPYFDQIPRLAVGEALYLSHDGTTQRIRTPKPPVPPQSNYAEYIKKRIVNSEACKSSDVSQDERNASTREDNDFSISEEQAKELHKDDPH